MRIVIGANHRGVSARGMLAEMLRQRGDDVVDCGVFDSSPVDYPDIAVEVASKVSHGNAERGILIGGMGFGMAIAANKFPGVRAVLCHDEIAAEISRRHCDCNVLCLSSDLTAHEMLRHIVESWLTAPFEGGRHARRLERITRLEDENMKR
ncbi:MAG: ribose 5-phosphate isomerase B [Thermoguttaceae bacterium]|jgi:ribose 5-phosphate isomerase B